MTAAEFRAALDALGITQSDFARWLPVEFRTVNRWARDEVAIRPPVARLVQALLDGWRPDDWPG